MTIFRGIGAWGARALRSWGDQGPLPGIQRHHLIRLALALWFGASTALAAGVGWIFVVKSHVPVVRGECGVAAVGGDLAQRDDGAEASGATGGFVDGAAQELRIGRRARWWQIGADGAFLAKYPAAVRIRRALINYNEISSFQDREA